MRKIPRRGYLRLAKKATYELRKTTERTWLFASLLHSWHFERFGRRGFETNYIFQAECCDILTRTAHTDERTENAHIETYEYRSLRLC